ncbi:hypothetical protein J1614_001685 [Plenodomus biglobosus]|nr:hypothetical protein J1614_001685 [Plenodomus biglobosus]
MTNLSQSPTLNVSRMDWLFERNIFRSIGGSTYAGWQANEDRIQVLRATTGHNTIHDVDSNDEKTEEEEGEKEEVESVIVPTRGKRARSMESNEIDGPLIRQMRGMSPERRNAINTLWAMHVAEIEEIAPAHPPTPKQQRNIDLYRAPLTEEQEQLLTPPSSQTDTERIAPASQPTGVVSTPQSQLVTPRYLLRSASARKISPPT